jgi:FHA domain
MSIERHTPFIIERVDRAEEAKTIIRDGLTIGRLEESDIRLNHPRVSRLHAGINEIEGYFYLINLSASSATTLNGRIIPFNESDVLVAGDEIQIGPFFLHIDEIEQATQTLRVRVVRQYALDVGERETRHQKEAHKKQLAPESRVTGSSEAANAIKVFWGKRSRAKAGRPSFLHPKTPPRPGKARFNWTPTRDLLRPWPFSIFFWALIFIGALSAVAAFKYKKAFAPAPISDPHTRTTFTLMPAIAKQPVGNSCTVCHALGVSVENREKMNINCAVCHQTEAFSATITRAHREAGITCTTCHAEHRGESFRPMEAALDSCAKCHSDENKKLYNGRSVHTPHGGTYGYPVINGEWVWKGLDEEELAEKPEIAAYLEQNGVTSGQTQEWRRAQFHAIHLNRVRVAPGFNEIEGIEAVDGELSCSSCHKSGDRGTDADRAHLRTTCARCHNHHVFHKTSRTLTDVETPSCTSCHVQHVRDVHWTPSLLSPQTGASGRRD